MQICLSIVRLHASNRTSRKIMMENQVGERKERPQMNVETSSIKLLLRRSTDRRMVQRNTNSRHQLSH